MAIFIAITSIVIITAVIWAADKVLPLRLRSGQAFKICPICAGVSGTWLWMLAGVLSGQLPISNYQLPMAILMGGSVVGLAYQGEKHLASVNASRGKALLWKSFFIPAGFATAYGLVSFSPRLAIPALAVSGIIAAFFLLPVSGKDKQENKKVGEIEEKMKNCC